MFQDRSDAGKKLAPLLEKYQGNKEVIVIGLPRGGVITAREVASFLKAPLDVICPRKVGAPFNPELAIGAVTETGEGFFNEEFIRRLEIPKEYLEEEVEKERKRATARLALYRKGKPPLDVKGKIVIIVDDGLATGATMKAALLSLKKQKAQKLIVAVPVAPPDTVSEVKKMADEVYCIDTPWLFQAVGQFYVDFSQTEDEEVIALLSSYEH